MRAMAAVERAVAVASESSSSILEPPSGSASRRSSGLALEDSINGVIAAEAA